jgi:phytoene synthase
MVQSPHTANPPSVAWPLAFWSSHFAPAFYFLTPDRRRALKIVYAVFRVIDDAVDKKEAGDPAPFLAAWKNCFETLDPSGLEPFGHGELAVDFVAVSKQFDIPMFSFLDFLRQGVGVDLARNRFETPMDTESYCYGVAGTVGIACLPIFGVPWQEAKDYAVRLGVTVQWINSIRDVGVDAAMDRIYLPQDHLEKFGCSAVDILEGRPTEAFSKLMRYEGEVARSHYRRAQELLPEKWRRELLPARIMGEIYMKLLAKIEKHEYPVLTKKIKLNLIEKGIVTWKTVRS